MPKALEERVPYSAIVDRPKLTLPGNARLAVWVIVNVENWEIRRSMPRMVLPPPSGVPLLPDLPNWAWHEYGMRVGFWRFLECLTHRNIVSTLALNGSVCQRYPSSAKLRSPPDGSLWGMASSKCRCTAWKTSVARSAEPLRRSLPLRGVRRGAGKALDSPRPSIPPIC
jgi:hypothetical protein